MCDATAITNLMHRYGEYIDAGDFAGAASLFGRARIKVGAGADDWLDAEGIREVWEGRIIRYPDGTPRTKHIFTNAIVEFQSADRATARSCYSVLQQVDDGPLQTIVTGRYHDRFEKVAGEWHYTERDYTLMDLIGDLSAHLRKPIPQ